MADPILGMAALPGRSSRKALTTDLECILSYWQDRLSLHDWEITISRDENGLVVEQAVCGHGGCTLDPVHRLAHISILPDDHARTLFGFDLEFTILHELLHLQTIDVYAPPCGAPPCSPEAPCAWCLSHRRNVERVISSMARTLLRLRRSQIRPCPCEIAD